MTTDEKNFSICWTWQGLTPETLEEKARWIEDPRNLGSGCVSFFRYAGKLIRCSHSDHTLISPAFFHAVIGLERALRVHYKSETDIYGSLCQGSDKPFVELFRRAINDGIFHDDLFASIPVMPDWLATWCDGAKSCTVEDLAVFIPKLRNHYFHGTSLFGGELIFIAVQLRELADALKTKGEISLRY